MLLFTVPVRFTILANEMSVPSMDFSTWPPMASRLPVIDTMSAQHPGATVEGSIRINGAALPVGGVV